MLVDLTKEQIKDILTMLNNATFQGHYAEKVVELKKKLNEALSKGDKKK